MAPLSSSQTGSLDRDQTMSSNFDHTPEDNSQGRGLHSEDNNNLSSVTPNTSHAVTGSPPVRVVWLNVAVVIAIHLAALFGGYLMFTSAMWQTNIFAVFLYQLSGLGVTAGAHRLWSHRSYKAKLPLRTFLAFCFTVAFQWDILVWCRNHRVHHKYSETDADPHNARKGFFFSHIGWIMCRKHPDVIKKGKNNDFSDLMADPVVRFQRRYYLRLVLICCFVLPTIIPMYFWGETITNSFFVAATWRHVFTLNQTFLVNSAAHMWGQRPYDANINPAENFLVVVGALGEGFHNYHHTFPYDYATGEYGTKYNLTTMFIDAMAWIGQAYDRKTASRKMIQNRKLKTVQDKQL